MEGSSHTKNQLDSFSRFDRTPTCDEQKQTDGQTDTGPWLVPALAKRQLSKMRNKKCLKHQKNVKTWKNKNVLKRDKTFIINLSK